MHDIVQTFTLLLQIDFRFHNELLWAHRRENYRENDLITRVLCLPSCMPVSYHTIYFFFLHLSREVSNWKTNMIYDIQKFIKVVRRCGACNFRHFIVQKVSKVPSYIILFYISFFSQTYCLWSFEMDSAHLRLKSICFNFQCPLDGCVNHCLNWICMINDAMIIDIFLHSSFFQKQMEELTIFH